MSWSRQFLDSLLTEQLPSGAAHIAVPDSSSLPELEAPVIKPRPRRRSIGRRAMDNIDRIRAIIAMCGLWLLNTFTTYLVILDAGTSILNAVLAAIVVQGVLTGCELYILRKSGFIGTIIAIPLIGVDAVLNVRGTDIFFPAATIEFAWANPIMWVALLGGAFVAILPELILNTLREK